MSNESIIVKIESIVKALGGRIDTLNARNISLADLGLDSLKTMDLILSVEQTFQIEIPDEKLNTQYLRSITTIAALVEDLTTKR